MRGIQGGAKVGFQLWACETDNLLLFIWLVYYFPYEQHSIWKVDVPLPHPIRKMAYIMLNIKWFNKHIAYNLYAFPQKFHPPHYYTK